MFPFGPRKQIRTASVTGDVSLYDAGRIFICTTGEASTAEIGKLWVDYEVDLFVPQNSPAQYLVPTATSLYTISGASQTLATGVAEIVVYDAVGFYDPLGIGSCVAGVFTPPAGCYLITAETEYRDSVSEVVTCTTSLQVDGAFVPSISYDTFGAFGAASFYSQSHHWIVACSGTTTIGIWATMTGATGSLSVYGTGDTQVLFRLA